MPRRSRRASAPTRVSGFRPAGRSYSAGRGWVTSWVKSWWVPRYDQPRVLVQALSRPRFCTVRVMNRYRYCVIGAGIVGLSTAHHLLEAQPGASVVVLEAADTIAAHQTGHNSGVIHSGIYYAPGSLKATFCKAGERATKDFCTRHGI